MSKPSCPTPKAARRHATANSASFQRSSPQNNFRRIIAAPIQRDLYCFDTVSYVTPDSSAVDLDCVLALLNSRIYDFWFRLTSTNSKVNAWQFNNLPFVLLEDSDTDATALIEDGQWAALVELLIEEGGAPRWVEVALAELARQMSVAESKRVLASRSERSKLSADAARLQRHADSLIGALFGLSQQQQRYVEERLKLML